MSESNPIKQFEANPTSKTYAIKAKCAQCFGCTRDYLETGFRHSISSCTSLSCPLHRLRPFQAKKSLSRQILTSYGVTEEKPCKC
jgi:hypothetical protein